jgi:hypothetical protein
MHSFLENLSELLGDGVGSMQAVNRENYSLNTGYMPSEHFVNQPSREVY